MKTFGNVCVVAAIVSVVMTGGMAKADFNNQDVENGANFLAQNSQTLRNGLSRVDIPRVQKVFFRNGLNQIIQRSQQMAELASQPDDQVEDQLEQLAQQNLNTARQLLERAENLGNEELFEFMVQIEFIADELLELVD
jgi:hypothetical protein